MTEYVCSLSGVEAEAEDVVDDAQDSLGDLPVGWTKVTFQRRLMNPRWDEIQQAKDLLVQAALEQIPEEARENAAPVVEIQIDAQFAALEASTDKYIAFDEVVYVAPPELDRALASEFYSVRDRLGLPIPLASEGDSDEEK
jgi:hypothetical protein